MKEPGGNRDGRILAVGFMPLLDCALLVVAHEKGFVRDCGIRLRLVREVSWANIRDRVAFGHFNAAHMLGPMVVASSLLASRGGVPLLAPAALGIGGNAITVSRALWKSMVQQGAALGASPAAQAEALARVIAARRNDGGKPLTLAMVFPFSCHNYQLRDWLVSAGVDPDRDLRLVVTPPPMLVEALRTGQVDGFCVGEPWNSLAVDSGLGIIVAVASDIWPCPPEKVLGMRSDFVEKHPQAVRALVSAVASAARRPDGCDQRSAFAPRLNTNASASSAQTNCQKRSGSRSYSERWRMETGSPRASAPSSSIDISRTSPKRAVGSDCSAFARRWPSQAGRSGRCRDNGVGWVNRGRVKGSISP